jgi:hypothetical protein
VNESSNRQAADRRRGKKIVAVVVLLAILVGVIGYVVLDHKTKLEQWEKAKQAIISQVELAARALQNFDGRQKGSDSRAQAELRLKQWRKLNEDADGVDRQLLSILKHKPGWFGSTSDRLSVKDQILFHQTQWNYALRATRYFEFLDKQTPDQTHPGDTPDLDQ